jgi:UDP-N-acetylglucosamine 2-epimerase (non-hydrolysing)
MAMVGTRPEAIKMAPVIKALRAAGWCKCLVVATSQHRHLVDPIFDLFEVSVDVDLDVMQEGQSLSSLSSRLFERIDAVYDVHKPEIVLAQGDTTTVAVSAMAAFYRRIPFAHVEAGLRTGDLNNPFPEEFNRIVAGRVASFHFAPTETARSALLAEGVSDEAIFVTGNTVIDALYEIASRELLSPIQIYPERRLILMTAHRRENFGAPMERIFRAVRRLTDLYPDVEIVYPVHPNPAVREPAFKMLSGIPRLHLIAPVGYEALIALLKRCTLVLTDSGGIQEEAPALAKPVLVMREETERPEGVACGVAKLIGTNEAAIVKEVGRLLDDEDAYNAMARASSPYGDGRAADRIAAIIGKKFGKPTPLIDTSSYEPAGL